jgi:hypothetical protein
MSPTPTERKICDPASVYYYMYPIDSTLPQRALCRLSLKKTVSAYCLLLLLCYCYATAMLLLLLLLLRHALPSYLFATIVVLSAVLTRMCYSTPGVWDRLRPVLDIRKLLVLPFRQHTFRQFFYVSALQPYFPRNPKNCGGPN